MEVLSVRAIPRGKQWQYEPKWDGFRSLALRDGSTTELQSKSNNLSRAAFPNS